MQYKISIILWTVKNYMCWVRWQIQSTFHEKCNNFHLPRVYHYISVRLNHFLSTIIYSYNSKLFFWNFAGKQQVSRVPANIIT